MSRLRIAVSDSTRDREPPKTWQEFEELCTDVFPLLQDEFSITRDSYVKGWFSSGYGKTGNKQCGVDVFDYFSTATIQCKHVEKFNLSDLKTELELLKGYPHPVSVHFIITSLDKTTSSVQDYIKAHNESLVILEGNTWPKPELPKNRPPMLLELNWQGLKKFLAKDFFLASKWELFPYQGRYVNLNGLDINKLESAVRTRHCFLPSGRRCKPPHVLEAIKRITQSLNTIEIGKIGETHIVYTLTIEGMLQFVKEVNQAMNHAKDFDAAIDACNSLDNYSKHRALTKLDEIAIYYQRIDAFKYIRRLYGAVLRLSKKLNNDDYFYHIEEEIEFKDGQKGPIERTWERRYRLDENSNDDIYPTLSRDELIQDAKFIVRETARVREESIPY